VNFCTRCVMPDTKPGVVLDERGLCNACRSQEFKQNINWKHRRQALEKIVADVKTRSESLYDCVVPVSGGKNSWYQAWVMAKEFDMKVLCVCLGAHLPTTEGIHNLNQMIKDLNIDLIKVTLKPSVYKKIRRRCFVRQGEPNWAEHCAVFSSVVNVAQIYGVQLIVWGEDIAIEFGGAQHQKSTADAIDINHNDLLKDKDIHDWLENDISERDVFFYKYPDYESLSTSGIKSIYLGHFDNWDGREHYNFVQKRGFHSRKGGPLSGNYIDYDNIDEKLCEINIWMKYIKFGFWRATDQCCYDIWNGRLDRNEAVDIVNRLQDEFPKEYLDDFLRFHDLTEKEFWQTVEKFRNKEIWQKLSGKWQLQYRPSKHLTSSG